MRMPTTNHTASVTTRIPTFSSSSTPSKLFETAIDESKTKSTTAMMSSKIRMDVAPLTNRSLPSPASSIAFMTMVVEDIQSMAARKIEFMLSSSANRPTP